MASPKKTPPSDLAAPSATPPKNTPSASANSFLKTLRARNPFTKPRCPSCSDQAVPPPSPQRRQDSLTERPFDLERYISQSGSERGTVLYLAYGSNLCYETFQGRRGIKPLAQINVVVPELRLAFDLPGIPYTEPCFATSSRREGDARGANANGDTDAAAATAATPLLSERRPGRRDYHKDRWRKGLVGVVYEVTPSDFAHIIATEGGGSSYKDILVTCHPLEAGQDVVPSEPSTPPFKAHTLFTPRSNSPDARGGSSRSGKAPYQRRKPSYAQPSARYLNLLTTGADEHSIPREYKAYLAGIRPYTITSVRQRIGQFVFLTLWTPLLTTVFALQALFHDKRGGNPKWLAKLMAVVFGSVWKSYDVLFKRLFGDGERTVYEDEDWRRKQSGRRVPDEEQRVLEKDRA